MNTHTFTAERMHNHLAHASFHPTRLSKTWAAMKTWNDRRIAIRELRAMPDVLLRDIGIERYQIKEVVTNSPRPLVCAPK